MFIKSKHAFDIVESTHPNDLPRILPNEVQSKSVSYGNQGFEIHTNRIQGFVLSWVFGLETVTIEDCNGKIWHTDIARFYEWVSPQSKNLDDFIDSILSNTKQEN